MARCSRCGAENPNQVKFCGMCGAELPAAGQSTKSISTKACMLCRKDIPADSTVCPYCGKNVKNLWAPAASSLPDDSTDYYEDYGQDRSVQESGTPTAGGVLIIIAGVLSIVQALILLAGMSLVGVVGSACLCSVLGTAFGVVAIFGGYSALNREGFVSAIVGGVLGILGVGLVIGAVLSLIGLILVAVSKDEFA